jgi:hypothetical protein
VEAQIHNPRTQEAEAEDFMFEVSLCYITRLCLKNPKMLKMNKK